MFVESNFTQNTLKKHALLVFVESNFTQNTEKTCFTGVWVNFTQHTEKTCFTGVCWVELHSEHTEKHALLVFVESNFTQNTEKHALLVFESNFTQNTLKNMLYWCLLSQTSLRTHWKTCFTGVLVKLHSEHTEKHALLVFVESNFTQNTLKKHALLVF